MDRVISLVAALVGLIAPGGAILVHTNADVQRHEMATEIAQLAAPPSSSEPAAAMATADPAAAASAAPASGSTPAAIVANGPTKDCIPLGTRFMASAGDSFPICKTRVVVKVAAVEDGLATITGAGDVAAGSIGQLDKGCTVSVFSADTSGYAEMRVTCQ